EMTALYRDDKETILATTYQNQGILPNSETFDADAVYAILDQEGCKSMRIYYGMNEDHKVHAIIVGVNEENEDMLPAEPVILEESIRCPTNCPPSSSLNAD
ncbi:MAG TPA: hypothetical protein VK498_14240, partial [Ferruginibacter sp.]|nr:hypothetical protein [Ferruginibacter sp.]